MIARVIVPIDHSDISEVAVPLAAHLAKRRGIPLVLVHVIEMSPEFMSYLQGKSEVESLLTLEEASQKRLSRLAETVEGVEVSTIVLRGRPAARFVEYVDGLEDSLIVMSSHGHSGFRRMMVGSTTARVVHASTEPVIVVRVAEEDAEVEIPDSIQKVLVPLDGSVFAEHALEAVYELVSGDDVMVRLVRVPEVIAYPSTMYGAASYETVDAYMSAMQTESEEYLINMADHLSPKPGQVSWEVRDGATSAAILEAALEFDADLIAMASHGRTGFRRFLLGSIAEQVLHNSPVPVMLVGPHDVEDADE
jgi:nucleotide-binding universal stress UspA family protein